MAISLHIGYVYEPKRGNVSNDADTDRAPKCGAYYESPEGGHMYTLREQEKPEYEFKRGKIYTEREGEEYWVTPYAGPDVL